MKKSNDDSRENKIANKMKKRYKVLFGDNDKIYCDLAKIYIERAKGSTQK